MKPFLLAATLTLALAAPVGAAVKPGTYAGKTDSDDVISFKVSRTKVSGVSARFTTVCANPSNPSDPLLVTLKPKPSVLGVSAKLRTGGRFSYKTDGETAAQNGLIITTFKGRIAKGKVKGTLRVQFPASTAGYEDYGDCDTGSIAFTARRK